MWTNGDHQDNLAHTYGMSSLTLAPNNFKNALMTNLLMTNLFVRKKDIQCNAILMVTIDALQI